MLLDLDAINRSRMYLAMGITLTGASATHAESELRPTEAMCWPSPQQPHGGVLFTQMDTTMATAAMAGPAVGESATMTLNINYLAPARGGVFTCTAEVERRGRQICFVRGETRDAQGLCVAVAQGSFRTFSAPA